VGGLIQLQNVDVQYMQITTANINEWFPTQLHTQDATFWHFQISSRSQLLHPTFANDPDEFKSECPGIFYTK